MAVLSLVSPAGFWWVFLVVLEEDKDVEDTLVLGTESFFFLGDGWFILYWG